jgi:hypothetical protein
MQAKSNAVKRHAQQSSLQQQLDSCLTDCERLRKDKQPEAAQIAARHKAADMQALLDDARHASEQADQAVSEADRFALQCQKGVHPRCTGGAIPCQVRMQVRVPLKSCLHVLNWNHKGR